MADEESLGLFAGCLISIVQNKALSAERANKLTTTLEENGATVLELKANGSIKIDKVTHVISETADFPQYYSASEFMVNVVTPAWVTSSLLKNRLSPLRPFTPDPKLIFSGITITTADLPTGDKDAIIGAVMAMGGQETSSLTKTVTHIVALSQENAKCAQALEKQMKCKFVLPHWFDDCLRLGRRIDEKPYLLPNPEIIHRRPDEDVKIPNSSHIEGAIAPRPEFLPTPTDSPAGSRKRLHVFNEKKIMLAADLGLSNRLRAIIEDLITGGGGTITTTVYKADIYVCHYRDGNDYIIASREKKDVGNLSWLYHLITHNEWTSPFRRLLHYPIPRNGIPGFEKFRITLSNYGGEARIYLENLVIAAGGEFTKSMKQDNTHLITARNSSEKCNAAQEWQINMVNHLWMEESYAKCQVQSLANPRYIHFPSRTNLGEVVGQTQFDREILEKIYFPRDPTESPEQMRNGRTAMGDKDKNTTFTEPTPKQDPAEAIPSLVRRPVGAGTPSRAGHSVTTPFSNRVGKENESPWSTSSRGAKDRAISKLQDLAPDVALYEKEKKRAGGGVWGGRRAADKIEQEREGSRKRSSSVSEDDAEEVSEDEGHANKKIKTGRPQNPPVAMKLLITGYERWLKMPTKEDNDRRKLRELGIQVIQDPTRCTHLAAPAMVRTKKFLTALAFGPVVLSTDFIDACMEADEIPRTKDYLLKDEKNEEKFNIKLKDALARAKKHPKRLLDGVVIYCTETIPNGPDTYKAIVEANGGHFAIYRGRGGTVIKPTDEEEEEEEPVYLLSGPKAEEKRLWPKFEQMARDGKMEPRVVITEWLLDTAMSQEIRWDESYLISKT